MFPNIVAMFTLYYYIEHLTYSEAVVK